MAFDKFRLKGRLETTDSSNSTSRALVVSGTIGLWYSNTVPNGWLECDGTTFSSATYPDLANALGDAYGTHVGTTYYLPDLRGRVVVGAGSGAGLTSRTASEWGGNESIAVTDDIITHTHSMSPHTHTLGNHTHSTPSHPYDAHGYNSHTHTINPHSHGIPSASNTGHTHGMWFGNTGGPGTTQPRNNTTGAANTVHSDNSGAHSHPGGATSSTGYSYSSDTSGTNTAATGSNSADLGSASPGTTSSYTGSNSTISVMQKSYALKYIIKV